MVKLTNLDGNPIYLWRAWIQLVRPPLRGEYQGGTKEKVGSVIILSGVQQAVKETVDEAIKVIG